MSKASSLEDHVDTLDGIYICQCYLSVYIYI